MIRRDYEVELDGLHYEVQAWIEQDGDILRVSLEDAVVFANGDEPRVVLEDGFAALTEAVGRLVEDDRTDLLWELGQAAHDAAVDAEISRRKEGGN